MVRERRQIISPNVGFTQQLKDFESNTLGLSKPQKKQKKGKKPTEKESKPIQELRKEFQPIIQILDRSPDDEFKGRLFIGNQYAGENDQLLLNLNITGVISIKDTKLESYKYES